MDFNQSAGSQPLVALVKTLEHAAMVLAQSDTVKNAAHALDAAVKDGDEERAVVAAKRLKDSAALVRTLLETADRVDPHVMDEEELRGLWKLKPNQVADEAITTGAYRERRLVLEAMAERTNRHLGRIAIGAAAIALLVPFVQQFVETL